MGALDLPIRDLPVEDGNLIWRNFLTQTLREASRPVLVFDETTVPAASLWSGTRRWIEAFGHAGMEPGDRILLSPGNGPAFVQVLLAAFWDDYTVVLSPSDEMNQTDLLESFDARISIGVGDRFRHSLNPNQHGPSGSLSLRPYQGKVERTASIRVFTPSQRNGRTRYHGYRTTALLSRLNRLNGIFSDKRLTVSLVPWSRISGLVFGLLYPLVSRQFILKPDCDKVTGENFNPILQGEGDAICHFNPESLEPLGEPAKRQLDSWCDDYVLDVRPDQFNYGEFETTSGITVSGRLRVKPVIDSTCGGVVLVSKTPGTVEVLGTSSRWSFSDNYEVRTRAVSTVNFKPKEGTLVEHRMPRWVKSSLAIPTS